MVGGGKKGLIEMMKRNLGRCGLEVPDHCSSLAHPSGVEGSSLWASWTVRHYSTKAVAPEALIQFSLNR